MSDDVDQANETRSATEPPADETATTAGSDDAAISAEATTTSIHRLHIWQYQAVRDVLWIVAAVGLFMLGYALQGITVPILIGLGLAYLFEPVIGWSSQRWPNAGRTRVVVGVLGLLVALLMLGLAIVVPVAVAQAGSFITSLPAYARNALGYLGSDDMPQMIRDWVTEIHTNLPLLRDGVVGAGEPVAAEAAGEMTEERVRTIVFEEMLHGDGAGMSLSAIGTAIGAVGMFLLRIGIGFFDLVFTLFLVGFFFVVFSTSYPKVREFANGLIPSKHRARVVDLGGQMDLAVSGFVRGRLLIALILGTIFAVGWTICGVPHALLLGLLVGFFTLAPYLAGIGLPIACILLAVHTAGHLDAGGFYVTIDADGTGHLSWWKIILFPSLVFVIAQLVDDYLLTPIIQGQATNLSPAAIIVAVLAGGSLAGLYGMLLAIPVAACLRILVVEVFFPKLKAWLEGEVADPLPID